jgi:hypothetical protein
MKKRERKSAEETTNRSLTVMSRFISAQKEVIPTEGETETSKEQVDFMHYVLKKDESLKIPLLQFVLDPASFSRTVENLFHCAFLIKDNHASIDELDEHGMPLIKPLDKSSKEGSNTMPKKQAVLSMDYDLWKRLCSKLNITKPFFSPQDFQQFQTERQTESQGYGATAPSSSQSTSRAKKSNGTSQASSQTLTSSQQVASSQQAPSSSQRRITKKRRFDDDIEDDSADEQQQESEEEEPLTRKRSKVR